MATVEVVAGVGCMREMLHPESASMPVAAERVRTVRTVFSPRLKINEMSGVAGLRVSSDDPAREVGCLSMVLENPLAALSARSCGSFRVRAGFPLPGMLEEDEYRERET
jgi:hypothetical protein